jgi:ATP-dependent DNA helicase RecQ
VNRHNAEALLKRAVGDPDVRFHTGQWEAIDSIANQLEKLLVIQRTGWGKSSVYFISTRILRDRGAGPTVIISPLLALMRNQIEAAERLGIQADTINSTNKDEWERVKWRILKDEVDAVLISPERLSNEEFIEGVLRPVADRIGLLVVDEAHCISDWGHDFRPDYRRLVHIIEQMPPNMPVLGTTATANNRVVEDIQVQLGDIKFQRGPLVRKSLSLQTLRLPDQAARLAWLAQNVPKLPGTGIIYVLTKRDARQVATWLDQNGVDSRAYYNGVEQADFENSNAYRMYLEELLLENQIKALVATPALGMGYDKPDLGFVIHYQAPGSVITYYQQVGRAGRAIDEAYGIMLSGREDGDIQEFFRRSAFPNEVHVDHILSTLEQHDGLSIPKLEKFVNLTQGQIKKVLKYLSVENPAPVIKNGTHWRRTPVRFEMDRERINRLTLQREIEWEDVQSYINTAECQMAYLRNALDDLETAPCGRCENCVGQPIVGSTVEHSLAVLAAHYLRHAEIPCGPRKIVPAEAFKEYDFPRKLPRELQAEEGRILSRWGDAGWGKVVADDKHANHFRDELVDAAAEMFQERWQPEPVPEWVTCVPSKKHPKLVLDFARRLTKKLGLGFVDAIVKVRDNEPQKLQQNSFHQCNNLDGAFEVRQGIPNGPVLLVDDIIDSQWTVTVLAALLRQAGSGPVYPMALATTSSED